MSNVILVVADLDNRSVLLKSAKFIVLSFRRILMYFNFFRYLESFERINFLGEDVEDVLNSSRPHTPVASFITTTSGTFPVGFLIPEHSLCSRGYQVQSANMV